MDKKVSPMLRFFARLIDFMTINLMFLASLYFFVMLLLSLIFSDDSTKKVILLYESRLYLGLFFLIICALWGGINLILLAKRSQTFGKMVMGLQIMDETGTQRANFGSAFWTRYILLGLLNSITFGTFGIFEGITVLQRDGISIRDAIAKTSIGKTKKKWFSSILGLILIFFSITVFVFQNDVGRIYYTKSLAMRRDEFLSFEFIDTVGGDCSIKISNFPEELSSTDAPPTYLKIYSASDSTKIIKIFPISRDTTLDIFLVDYGKYNMMIMGGNGWSEFNIKLELYN